MSITATININPDIAEEVEELKRKRKLTRIANQLFREYFSKMDKEIERKQELP
jgi:hypothetical protein